MMKIITEMLKDILSIFHNDGYAQQFTERHDYVPFKKDSDSASS